MGKIERASTDAEVVRRLGYLLEKTDGSDFSTTSALGYCTTIFAWVAQRVRREGEPTAKVLADRWAAAAATDGPWHLPQEFAGKNVLEAVVALRRATSHADGARVSPINSDGQLIGFTFDEHAHPFALDEHSLRRFGVAISCEFADHMEPAKAPK